MDFLIGLKFVSQDGEPKGKTYEYLMNIKDFKESFKESFGCWTFSSSEEMEIKLKAKFDTYVFTIVNNEGYDYRGAKVKIRYIEEASMFTINPSIIYKQISSFSPTGTYIGEYKKEFCTHISSRVISTLEDIFVKTPTDKAATLTPDILKPTGVWGGGECCCNTSSSQFSVLNTVSSATGTGVPYYATTYNPYMSFDQNSTAINSNLNSNLILVEGDSNMTNLLNLNFGKCSHNVKMSVYGPAFQSSNTSGSNGQKWVSFNKNKLVDVTGMVFDFDCLYNIPVAVSQVKEGDIIYHDNTYVKVLEKTSRGSLVCLEPWTNQEITVSPVNNVFGFNFFTKLINIMDGFEDIEAPSEDNPFGEALPMMLMMNNGSNDSNNLVTYIMMSKMFKNKDKKMDFDPMMFLLLNNNNNSNLLPLMMMMRADKK